METHALKHHYHHHHAAPASPTVTHSPSSLSAISGSSAPQTSSRSTAFPLLISSIESGQKQQQQSTPPSSFSRTKSSHQAGQNASGLTIQQQLGHLLGATAAVKHRAAQPSSAGHDSCQLGSLTSSNHSATNGGVKGTPRPKSAATPLATGLGRQQATAQAPPPPHGNKVIGAEGPSLTPLTPANALPYKKSLLARDPSPHYSINNGRGRNHHYHQHQPSNVQSNGSLPIALPVPTVNHVTPERDIPRLRSPPRSSMQHCGAKASPVMHHHQQHLQLGNTGANHTSHNHNVDHGMCAAAAAMTAARSIGATQHCALRCSAAVPGAAPVIGTTITASSLAMPTIGRDLHKSTIATGKTSASPVLSNSLSQTKPAVEESKPKEFKFFKEKAKGKQAGKAGAAKQPQVNGQNLTDDKKAACVAKTLKMQPPTPSEPLVATGKQTKAAKASSCSNNNRGNKKAESSKPRAASASRESRRVSENVAVAGSSQSPVIDVKKEGVEEKEPGPPGEPRLIEYYECLLEGFSFQVFDNANDLMRSVLEHDIDRKDALDRELETLNLDLPPDPNEYRPTTPSDSVIIVCRDQRTSDEESDLEEDSDTAATCLSPTHSASRSRAAANKSNKRTSPAKKKPNKSVMAKRATKGKTPQEESSEEESADDEQSEEESDEEDESGRSKPANRKSVAERNAQDIVARCNHKHAKGQKACYKCLAAAKKSSAVKPTKTNEKNEKAVVANKKKAPIGRKPKSKVTKGKLRAASSKVKNRAAVAAKGKTRKNLRAAASAATSEDESSEHEEADSDDEESSEEEESDATQADSDHSSNESDSSDEDQDESDATSPERPHLFDLIKDTRRRAAVHKNVQDHPTTAAVTASRTKTNRQSSSAVTDLGPSTSASGPPGTTSSGDSETGGKKKAKVSGKMVNAAKRTAANGRAASNNTKKASGKPTKTAAKKAKDVVGKSDEEHSEDEDSEASDEEEEAEVIPAKLRKVVKRNLRSQTATAKANQKKAPPAKKQVKITPKKRKKPESEESEEESESEEDENSTEEEEDQNTTEEENEDEEMDEESSDEDSDEEDVKKGKDKTKAKLAADAKKAKKKPVRQTKAKPGAKVSKTTKTAKGKKPEKCSSKCKNKSEDETEASESDNVVEKEEDSKSTMSNASLTASNLEKCKPPPPDKDVYTFELSPASEVAPATRLVLSSENRARHENMSTKVEEPPVENVVATSNASNSTSHVAPSNALSFEPLRPDYSHYESSAFGPNASLSSLSQLSQSIGGGSGPIVLNHQNGPTNCYPMPIKEEPREDAYRVMGKTCASKQTPPPAMAGDQLATSHNLGANLIKNGHHHPNRLWSNASAGSLMSSSSSSSNSPVPHPPFAHHPPIPATPASLASYFSPSTLPPTYSSQGQPDLMRRDLNSRLMGSMDHNHLLSGGPAGLSIAPPAGSMPVPPPTHFGHHSSGIASSPLIPPSSGTVPPPSTLATATPYLPPSTVASSYMNEQHSLSKSGGSVVHLNNHFTKPITVSVVTPSTAARLISSPLTFASTAAQIGDKKSCRHVKIAFDIFSNSRASRANLSESNTTLNHQLHHHKSPSSSKSSKGHSHSTSSSNSSTEPNPLVQSSISKPSTSSSSSKHSSSVPALPPVPTSVDSFAAAVASIGQQSNNSQPRSQSATFPSQYPRYPTPGPFAAPSMSAPPSLSAGLFPPTTSALGDSWARPPPPMPGAPPLYRSQYPTLTDFYTPQATASSMMAAWASGIRPSLDLITPNTNANTSNTNANSQVTKQSSSSHSHSHNHNHSHSHSHSHKRKHEEIETSNKDRASSSNRTPTVPIPYQNGDIRHEHSNKKHHSSSKHSSKLSSHITENGGERLNRAKSESTTPSLSTPNPFMPNSSLPSTPLVPPLPFGGAHHAAAEQQRYLELLQMQASSVLGGANYSNSPSTSFMANSNTDLASKPLWPFGLGTPSAPISSAPFPSHLGPSPFAQDLALKSLQDISQRPGMVQQDSQSLFARYSMLNASGGGASILDKLNKEEVEKMHQNQARSHSNSFNANRTESSRPPSSGRSSNSLSNGSRPHSAAAPPPPPPAMQSTMQPPTLCPTPAPIPFSPLNYMNLNPLASATYFQQSLGSLYSGHPSLMNGTADPTKMNPLGSTLGTGNEHTPQLGHFPHHFPGFGPAGVNPLLAQANPLGFLNAKTPTAAAINFNSTR